EVLPPVPSMSPPPGSRGAPAARPSCSLSWPGSLAALFEQLRDDRRPSRLVTRAETLARVAVEVLVEEDQVAPVRVGLKALTRAVHRTAAHPSQEDRRQTPRQLDRDVPERHHPPGPGGALHGEAVAEVIVEFLDRLDQQL